MSVLSSSIRRLAGMSALLVVALAPTPASAQSLRGSQSSVDATYDYARRRGLTFHRTSRTVKRAAAQGKFVKLSTTTDVRVKGVTFPYVLPSTRTFVQRLGAE